MSAYGWTIDDVDKLTIPQMTALIKEIRQYPPTNVLLAEFLKGLGGSKGSNTLDIDRQLSKIPHQTQKKGQVSPKKSVFSKSGNRILKIIDKRTGKRIV